MPDGPRMREKPTLIMLHGGPGFDHSIYKPAFSALADVAQVIYLDHRGNGRSDDGPHEAWTLAQWGDDVRGFCDALGIEKPIVLGVSFGGMVAIAYATRHPDHPGKLVLVSTEAKGESHRGRRVALFEKFGGPEVGALARRRFLEGGAVPPDEAGDDWPFHTTPADPRDPNIASRDGWPAGGAALVQPTRRRGTHLQHAPRSRTHPLPDAGHGRRGRPDDSDRGAGRHRRGAFRPISSVSSGLPIADTHPGCARTWHGADPRVHRRSIELDASSIPKNFVNLHLPWRRRHTLRVPLVDPALAIVSVD